jgi:hypothetical protein
VNFKNAAGSCVCWESEYHVHQVHASNGYETLQDAVSCWDYIASLEGKTEVLGEKPVTVTLCPPQISHGLRSNPGVRGVRLATDRLSRGTAVIACNGVSDNLLTAFIHHTI